jgi:hypothetical protein
MSIRLSGVAVAALLTIACGGGPETPVGAQAEGLALVSVRPHEPTSLNRTWMSACSSCTAAFGADIAVSSSRSFDGVNLWLDGWAGNKRCLYSQHDSPADGFSLTGGEPVVVSFRHATVECTPPFVIDRVDARARAFDTIVFQGSWVVKLEFRE